MLSYLILKTQQQQSTVILRMLKLEMSQFDNLLNFATRREKKRKRKKCFTHFL